MMTSSKGPNKWILILSALLYVGGGVMMQYSQNVAYGMFIAGLVLSFMTIYKYIKLNLNKDL